MGDSGGAVRGKVRQVAARLRCAVLLACGCSVLAPASAYAVTYVVPKPTAKNTGASPTSPNSWYLGGTATFSRGIVQLTSNGGYEAGVAYWTTPVDPVGLNVSFNATIGAPGADGLALALLDATANSNPVVGGPGGALAFPGPGLGVTLTENTRPWSCYPSDHFVGITDGRQVSGCPLRYLATGPAPTLGSATNKVQVAIRAVAGGGDEVEAIVGKIKSIKYVAQSLPSKVFIGFTAGTGIGTETQSIGSVAISSATPPLSCPATNTTLTTAGTLSDTATVEEGYAEPLAACGGQAPYHWSVIAGRLPAGLLLDPATGNVSGTPLSAGTSAFTIGVTDSSSPAKKSNSAWLIAVHPSSPPHSWGLLLNQENPALTGNSNTGPTVSPPHVAFVLVGKWWCSLYLASPTPPPLCKKPSGSAAVQSSFASALNNLVLKDYAPLDYNASDYANPLSTYYQWVNCPSFCESIPIGTSITMRTPANNGGAFYAGPVSHAAAEEANLIGTLQGGGLAASFGVNDQTSVNDTVFVFVHEPGETTSCPNKSTNYATDAGSQPPGKNVGNTPDAYIIAQVFLEDATHNCSLPEAGDATTPLSPEQFATYATSHELSEAIATPGPNYYGWIAQGTHGLEQISDPCTDRNEAGETNYEDSQYPFYNFTRDTKGTLAAAYVDPNTGQCSLDPSTGIPPWPTLYYFTSGSPGSQFSLVGERYTPGDTVEVSFKDKSGVTTTYAPFTVGTDRLLDANITVPAAAAAGKAVITVSSKQSGVKFVEVFTVT